MTVSLPDSLQSSAESLATPIEAQPRTERALLLSGLELPASPWQFIARVVRGRYRVGLAVMVAGEAIHAACGILLPSALSRIITSVTSNHGQPAVLLGQVTGPVLLFTGLCAG